MEKSITSIENKIKDKFIISKPKCTGCEKFYMDSKALLQHQERSQLCKKWLSILEKKNPLAIKIQEIHTKVYENPKEKFCESCERSYSSWGNLNKHLKHNPVCRKLKDWSLYSSDY